MLDQAVNTVYQSVNRVYKVSMLQDAVAAVIPAETFKQMQVRDSSSSNMNEEITMSYSGAVSRIQHLPVSSAQGPGL